jgi:hypothetical protein
MTAEEKILYPSWKAARSFFGDSKPIIDSSPLVTEDVSLFNTYLSAYELLLDYDKEEFFFTAGDKNTLKKRIATSIRLVLDKLMAHAIKTNDEDLKKACKTTASAFLTASEDDFVLMAKAEISRMKLYPEVLEKYLISAEFQRQIVLDVETVEKMKPKIDVERSQSSVATLRRSEAIKTLKEFVNDVLSVSVQTLLSTQPDFVAHYNTIIQTRSVTISSTQLLIKIVDSATSLPVGTVKIETDDPEFKAQTDGLGVYAFKTGRQKMVTFTVSKVGFTPQTLTVEAPKRGKSVDLVIRLVSEFKGLQAG